HSAPRLQRYQHRLQRAGESEKAEQGRPAPLAQADPCRDPDERDERQVERQAEGRGLAQRDRAFPRAAADDENRDVDETADDEQPAYDIAGSRCDAPLSPERPERGGERTERLARA